MSSAVSFTHAVKVLTQIFARFDREEKIFMYPKFCVLWKHYSSADAINTPDYLVLSKLLWLLRILISSAKHQDFCPDKIISNFRKLMLLLGSSLGSLRLTYITSILLKKRQINLSFKYLNALGL